MNTTIGYNNQTMDKNNLKPMGFLWTEQYYKTHQVIYDPGLTIEGLGQTGIQSQNQVHCS